MENKNQQNENQNLNQNLAENEEPKKKFSLQSLIVPGIIAIILIVFCGIIYYAKVVKPKSDIDDKVGYKAEDYIQLEQYTGFDYEITQDMFDECVSEETDYYDEVSRKAEETDQVEFNYVGYVDGKKDANISMTSIEFVLGEDTTGIYKTFSDAIIGHKAGEKVEVSGVDATELSEDGSDYSDKEVSFTLKIKSVSKLVSEEINDEWVEDGYFDDYGLETADDFYNWCKDYLQEEAKVELWQMVLDNTQMSSYPQEVYDDVVLEFTQDANYYADLFGITADEYLTDFCGYTDETLEEEYINEVKSELAMWYIVKEQGFEATAEEIEEQYEELYLDMDYDSADDMKADYTDEEMEKVVLLGKVQDYVYENSNIIESFVMPNE